MKFETWNLKDFQDSIYFNNEGRCEARFAFKGSHETLPEYLCEKRLLEGLLLKRSLCEKRLLKLYNKLKNDAVLLKNTTMTFLLSKKKQVLLRPLKVQELLLYSTLPGF